MAIGNVGLPGRAPYSTPQSAKKADLARPSGALAATTSAAGLQTLFSSSSTVRESYSTGTVIRGKGMTVAQSARADQVAKDAAAISESQGLPSGQYDFTNITQGQLRTILDDMVVNRNANPDDLLMLHAAATSSPASQPDPNMPRNVISQVTDMGEFAKLQNDKRTANFAQRSLDFIDLIIKGEGAGANSQFASVNTLV